MPSPSSSGSGSGSASLCGAARERFGMLVERTRATAATAKVVLQLCSVRICSRRALKRCSERMYAARKVLSEQEQRGGRKFAVSRAAIIGWL